MEEQVTIQISYVELKAVDPAPFINKLIKRGLNPLLYVLS
jgi:hypothetical protein